MERSHFAKIGQRFRENMREQIRYANETGKVHFGANTTEKEFDFEPIDNKSELFSADNEAEYKDDIDSLPSPDKGFKPKKQEQVFDTSCLNLSKAKIGFLSKANHLDAVEELPTTVRFKTQPFVCELVLEIKRSLAKSNWSIGLAVGCTDSSLIACYENAGYLKITNHPITHCDYNFLNDSASIQLPFVTYSNALFEIDEHSLLANQAQRLSYNCVHSPYVSWETVVNGKRHNLTRVSFSRSCLLWLLAVRRGRHTLRHYHQRIKYFSFDSELDELFPLMTVAWECGFKAEIDVRRKESRVVYYDQTGNSLPRLLPQPLIPTRSMILGPTVSDTESAIFYNCNKDYPAFVLMQPKYTVVPWGQWCHQMQQPNSALLQQSGKNKSWKPKVFQLSNPNDAIDRNSSENRTFRDSYFVL